LPERAAAGVVGVAKFDDLLGVVACGFELAELVHALRCFRGEGRVVERAHPGREGDSGRLVVKGALGGHQSTATICWAAEGGECSRFHGVQPSSERGVMAACSQDASSCSRELEAILRVSSLLGKVAEACVDVRYELAVVRCGCEVKRAIEVVTGAGVDACVVGHPSGHFG
jgi:hypothetical protein